MPPKGYKIPRIIATCKCGKKYEVLESRLKSGNDAYCSSRCKNKFKFNLIGNRFGRLVVLFKYVNEKTNERVKWICKCDCGNFHCVCTSLLQGGRCKSCGCYRVEKSTLLNTTHGFSNNRKSYPEYHIWLGMKSRCFNENNERFADWGGRGITVDSKWLGKNGFPNFYSDMGKRPSDNHSIERRNNDGNYCPENCFWATKPEQNRNTRANVYYEHDGVRMVITDWAKELRVTRSTIKKHLKKKTFSEVVEFYKNQTSGAWYLKRQNKKS